MELAPLFLSRVQFVWVVSFHILLPAFTMGLATFIAVLEGLHFFKRDPSICVSRSTGCGSLECRSVSVWSPES